MSTRLVEFLRSRAPDAKPITPQTDADDPYYQAGAHPDIVEQVWDTIGATLPAACRCLLYGVPVLVQPDSGVVLAIALGTGYAVLVPEEEIASARADGYRTAWDVFPSAIDATTDFGPAWMFGRFENRETRWCRQLYERLSVASAGDGTMLAPDTPARARHDGDALVLTVLDGPSLNPREVATNPDGDAIERCIRSLSWSAMTFVTLERGRTSLTASGSIGDGWSMSYVDDDEEHVAARPPEDLDVVIAIMRRYASNDRSWREMIDWD